MDDVAFTRLRFDGAERFQRLAEELGAVSLGINLRRIAPDEAGRIHAHRDQEEIYVVLAGELVLTVDGREHRMRPYEAARLAPAVRRQLACGGPDTCVVLAVGAAGEHDVRDGVRFESWDAEAPAPPA